MLTLLATLLLTSPSELTPPASPPLISQTDDSQEILRRQIVRPLPGQLNNIPVFNSNSPELVLEPGILLSTFSPDGKVHPNAHLEYTFEGRFDVFAHHVAKAPSPDDLRTLYIGILLHNPTNETVTVKINEAASYLSQPDAPFIELPPHVDNPDGEVYAGPGSRVMSDILRGRHQEEFRDRITLPPQESRLLLNLPIPVKELDPPLNGRSTYMRLESDGEIYAASLAMFAQPDEQGEERAPTLAEWETLLQTADLATPRDRAATPPDQPNPPFYYGRVAGVSIGSEWEAVLTDSPRRQTLVIPSPGQTISYGISTLDRGRMGTGQNQSAPMAVRYPDTAYEAHGNYGVEYDLTLPLYNPTQQPQTVEIALETAIKQDQLTGGLRFFDPLPQRVFFRGTVAVEYIDETGTQQTRYTHLVQRRGQEGNPLVTLTIPPKSQNSVRVRLLYPPDSTPPQVLSIRNP
ncbi:DUF3370 domain-containing protein [Spirulina sp. CS-785/01]|uniref:DUF3370 domain-containing protein n=1 Tax=Spirulina sp. CS-785/01 TaxID=3021716 RepID=UPI00232C17DD|nr:DUF3370 domain-containing protein [Spirulina sp. CS-785/01]MDB9315379.1 DUF3370 domain-containing protein [Spirulina sp. CS-785/01]